MDGVGGVMWKHSPESDAGHGCLLGPRGKFQAGHSRVHTEEYSLFVGGEKGKCAYTEHMGESIK